jgi:hypothetical protein
MIHSVSLAVSFPAFGSNYYSQQAVSRKAVALVFDEHFEALLMPAAANHFSNEVVGPQAFLKRQESCSLHLQES